MLPNTQRQVNFNHFNLSNTSHKAPKNVRSRAIKSSNNRVVRPKRWGIAGLVLTYEKQNKIKCNNEILHHLFLYYSKRHVLENYIFFVFINGTV